MLLEFYGETCPHCIAVRPLIERLEKEEGVKVEKYEVWNNKENAKKMQEYAGGKCMGVSFFVNTETEDVICGEAEYERLKKWAGK